MKKSEISKELASTVTEMESERTWQERIVTELNDKNEQLKVLEHELSSDAISDLHSQADRAKLAYQDAEAEAKALERAYQQAFEKVQDTQTESFGLQERLVKQREKVRHEQESKATLTRSIDLLRKRLSSSALVSRATMQEVGNLRSRAEQLRQAFDVVAGQYADTDRRRRSQEALVRAQLTDLCRSLE